MTNARSKDILFCLLALVVALVVLITSFRYQPASAYFVQVLAVFVVLCAVTFGYRRIQDAPEPSQTDARPELVGFAKVVLSILVYTGMLMVVGFPLATLLFLTGLMYGLGERRLVLIVPIALGLTATLYFLFFWFLGVYPPEALLTF